jgi:uncharacterized membrane protein
MGENMNVPIAFALFSLVTGGLVLFTGQLAMRNSADLPSFMLVDAVVFLTVIVFTMLATKHQFVLSERMTWLGMLNGFLAAVSVFAVMSALRLGGEGSIVYPIRSLEVVLAVILAFWVFREPVTTTKVIGLSMGVGSLILLTR